MGYTGKVLKKLSTMLKYIHRKRYMTYQEQQCNFKYRIKALERVVDGDTIDVAIDLGFDVSTTQRVRLLGIDTPESRTADPEEKKFGLLSKEKLKEWCLKAVVSDKDDIEMEIRCPQADSREKFGRVLAEVWVREGNTWTNVNRWLCENGYAVAYMGQNKKDVEELHMRNRERVKHELK